MFFRSIGYCRLAEPYFIDKLSWGDFDPWQTSQLINLQHHSLDLPGKQPLPNPDSKLDNFFSNNFKEEN